MLKQLLLSLFVLSHTANLLGAPDTAPGRNDSAGDRAFQRFAEHARKHASEQVQKSSPPKTYQPLRPPIVSSPEILPAPKTVETYVAKLPPVVSLPTRLEKPIVVEITPGTAAPAVADQPTAKLEHFNKAKSQEHALLDDEEPLLFRTQKSKQNETPRVTITEEVEAGSVLFSNNTSVDAQQRSAFTIENKTSPRPTPTHSDGKQTQLAEPPALLTGTLTMLSKQVLQWMFVLFVVLPIALKYNPWYFYQMFSSQKSSEDDTVQDTAQEDVEHPNAEDESIAADLSLLDEADAKTKKTSSPFAAVDDIEDIHAELSSALHDVDQYLSGTDSATGIALATKESKTEVKADLQSMTDRLLDSQQLQMQTTEFRMIANSAAHKAIKRYSDKQRITFRLLRGIAACMAAIGLAVSAWSVPGVYGLALGASCVAVAVIAIREYRAWQELREQE